MCIASGIRLTHVERNKEVNFKSKDVQVEMLLVERDRRFVLKHSTRAKGRNVTKEECRHRQLTILS